MIWLALWNLALTQPGLRKHLCVHHPDHVADHISKQYINSSAYKEHLKKFNEQLLLTLKDENGNDWGGGLGEADNQMVVLRESEDPLEKNEDEEYMRRVIKCGGQREYVEAICNKYIQNYKKVETKEDVFKDLGIEDSFQMKYLEDTNMLEEAKVFAEDEDMDFWTGSTKTLLEQFLPEPIEYEDDYIGEELPTEEEFSMI